MRHSIVTILLILAVSCYSKAGTSCITPDSLKEPLRLKTFCQSEAKKRYKNTLRDWQELNARAEVAWKEFKTHRYLENRFARLQKKYGKSALSYKTVAGTGLIVEIEGDAHQEYSLIIRPEMDGLPFPNAETGMPEVKHGCGHSAGMSVACNLAEMLLDNPGFRWRKVLFLFSPSEEDVPSGLDSMLKSMDLSKYGKLMALGQHVSPDVPNHRVEVRGGIAQASTQILKISIDASVQKGGHIANLNYVNPLEIWDTLKSEIHHHIRRSSGGAEYLLRWTNIITDSPADAPHNVLPRKATIVGNFRTYSPSHETKGMSSIDSLLDLYSKKYERREVTIRREQMQGIPVLENDSLLTERVRDFGGRFLGNPVKVHNLRFGADDFAFFKKYGIPAVLLRIGVEAAGGLHRQDFAIKDTTVLEKSLGLFAYLVYSLN